MRLRIGLAIALAVGLTAAAPAQDKSKFETKFEKDKPFYQELTTDVSQVVKVQGGSDLPLKHKQTFLFKWTPVSQDKDKWVVKQTIEGVKMTVDIAGNPINYDSTDPNPAGAAANPGLADFFKSLVGAEFTVTFGPGLKVEKVDGRDEFLKKLAGANPQMEALLKKILTEDALREMVDPSAAVTPPGEQAVGSSWEKKTTLTLGPIGSYDRTFKYTYKGKDPEKKDLDRVEVEPKLVYKAPTDQADGLLFRIKGGTLETVGSKPGVILYNAKTGRVESSDIAVTMKGNLDVAIGTTDTKVELYQEQRTLTKISDTSFLPKK
ncbi:MAG: DUF6263 family protein [Fimbriiglobus sp.]